MYKQIIIARKDLNMSAGKLAAQVSHASMAFLTNQMRKNVEIPDKCDFADDGIEYLQGTGGWYAAFGKACINTENKKLFDYRNSLEWYDSDIFDSEIIDVLIEKEFILGYKIEIIKRELDVEYEDVDVCDKCGKLMRNDLLIKNGEEYICPYCTDVDNGDKYKNGTSDYYREICKEVDEYHGRIKDEQQFIM